MNTNKIATGSTNKKLLAALAVLAVAFVVLAAVPAIATDSDAATTTATEIDSADDWVSVETGGNFILTSDISLGHVSIGITAAATVLDLNGHTITVTTTEDGQNGLYTAGTGVDVTIKNGTIVYKGNVATGNGAAINVWSNEYVDSLTLDAVTITSNSYAVSVNGNEDDKTATWTDAASNLTVKNGCVLTSTGSVAAITTNGQFGGEVIKISGSTVVSEEGPAIYAPSNGQWTITDSKITGVSGIDIRAGTIDISKSTITYNGPATEKTGGDGPAAFGVGISALTNSGYGNTTDSLKVTVSDDVVFVAGANAEDEILIGGFTYPKEGSTVTYVDVMEDTTAVSKPIDLTVGGLEITYGKDGTGSTSLGDGLVLAASATATVPTGKTCTLDGSSTINGTLVVNGKLTVPSGSTIRFAEGSSVTKATAGSVSVSGTVVADKDFTGASLTTLATTLGVRSTAIKTGYALTKADEIDGIASFAISETVVAAGETVVLTVVADSDSKIDSVYGTYTASAEQTKRATLNSNGTYSFVMPSYATELNAATSGALSVTYDLYLEDTDETVYYDQATGLTSDADITEPAAPVRDGYNFVGWFKDAACTIKAVFSGNDVNVTLSDGKSITVYALMQKTHTVTVTKTEGGDVSVSPAYAVKDSNVTLTITPADGYDLSGLTVAGKKITAMNGDDETKVGSKADSYTYTIKMPNNDVAVSVEFSKLYKISVSNDTTTSSQGSINAPTSPADKFAAGAEASFGITIQDGYAIKAIQITDTKGDTLSATEATVSYVLDENSTTKYTVTFTMPAQDVKVSATYAAARAVKLTGDDNVVLSVGKDKTSGATEKEVTLAIGAKVTVTFTPKDGYGVKTLTIDGATANSASGIVWTDGVGTYTYTVPETNVSDASLKAVSGELYKITVTQAGSGNIVQPIPESAVEGAQVSFTVLTDSADISLKAITVTYKIGSTDYAVYYPKSAGTDTANATAKIAYANGIATLTMPAAAVNVAFEFDDTVYYIVKVSDADHVKLYRTYTEKTGVLSDEVTDLTKVVADEYYVGITNQDGKDIKNASATRVVVTTDDTTHTTTSAVRSVTLTNYVLTASSAVYKIVIGADTTGNEDSTVSITANYTEHQSVISFEKPANGTITVTVDGKELKSGERAPYLKELVISVTADEDSEGYIPTEVKANQTPLTATNGVYTVTVGMEDIIVSATLAQGYDINYGKASGVEISGPVGQAVGEDVVLTVTVDEENYKLTSLKITYGDNNAEVKPVTVSGSTYTFEMPAGVVTVTPATTKISEVPVAAKNVEVGVMGVSNGSARVVVHSLDEGCYVPAGTVTVTFTYANALGIDVTVSAQASYAGTNTSAEYATVLVTLPAAVASAISSGSDVVAHATYAITDGASFDSIVVSLKGATA